MLERWFKATLDLVLSRKFSHDEEHIPFVGLNLPRPAWHKSPLPLPRSSMEESVVLRNFHVTEICIFVKYSSRPLIEALKAWRILSLSFPWELLPEPSEVGKDRRLDGG